MEKQMSFENEWINRFWYIHTMSYSSITKRNKLVIQAKTWMNLNYVEWKKPNKKEDILHDSIYRKLKKKSSNLAMMAERDPWRPRMGEHVEKSRRDEWQGVLQHILGVMDMLTLITMFSQVYTYGKPIKLPFQLGVVDCMPTIPQWRNARLLPISSQFYPI